MSRALEPLDDFEDRYLGGDAILTKARAHHLSGHRLTVVRRMVVERDGPMCRRCGGWVDVTMSGLMPDGPTLGHIIPRSKGGTDHPTNLGLEHRRCNLAASDRRDPPRALIATPIA
jgi:5-methylcytosine-specific restriction endonuclease McrA